MSGKGGVSLIVPVRDEEARIDGLAAIIATLRGRGGEWELLVVEDGSRDRTRELAEGQLRGEAGARLLHFDRNFGKGFAVREGVLASRGEFVAYIDLDLSVPLAALDAALPLLKSGWDAVVASRAHPDSRIIDPEPAARRLGGALFNAVRRWLLPTRLADTQCGFKAFRGDVARRVFSACRVDGFLFDVEVLWRLEREGRRVYELPVEWRHRRGSRVRWVGDTLRSLRDLALIRWRAGRGVSS